VGREKRRRRRRRKRQEGVVFFPRGVVMDTKWRGGRGER